MPEFLAIGKRKRRQSLELTAKCSQARRLTCAAWQRRGETDARALSDWQAKAQTELKDLKVV